MKKIYNAPYMKLIEVKNDILTVSTNNEYGNGIQQAPYRNIFSEELLSEEDFNEDY